MNDYLRNEVKLLKALQGITYKEIAEYIEVKDILISMGAKIEVKENSLYCWLKGYYDFGEDRAEKLKYIITCLKD